jgi:hypothetical protein
MGVKWDSTSAIHRLQESLRFSGKEGTVQHYDSVWGTHETIQVHCLNVTYSKVRVGKHLSDSLPIQNGLKQGDALSPLLFNFSLECH